MSHHIGLVTFLVHDHDDAIDFFTRCLRFDLREDSGPSPNGRWVVVGPKGATGTAGAGLLLAQATTEDERALVGRQAAGRVFLILNSSDFQADFEHLQAHGVRFAEAPRDEPYGTVAIFLDLYGNRWDLIQRR